MSLMRNRDAAECPCCGDGSETRTITHTIFDCPKLEDVRNDFSQKLDIILPETRDHHGIICRALESSEECLALIIRRGAAPRLPGSDTPAMA